MFFSPGPFLLSSLIETPESSYFLFYYRLIRVYTKWCGKTRKTLVSGRKCLKGQRRMTRQVPIVRSAMVTQTTNGLNHERKSISESTTFQSLRLWDYSGHILSKTRQLKIGKRPGDVKDAGMAFSPILMGDTNLNSWSVSTWFDALCHCQMIR